MKIGLKILRDKVAYLTNFQYIYIQLKASNINNKTFIIEYAKTDDSILEVCFVIRSYGKGELAMCYIRGVAQQTAVNRFNTWIRKAPGLEQRLQETGLSRTDRCYTPAQVRLIVNVLGEP